MLRKNWMLRALIGASFVVSSWTGVSPAFAYDVDVSLTRIEGQVTLAEGSLDGVSSNLEDRSGFIGVEDAKRRFENAVFAYLIGDYDSGAKEFFTLVEARAFVSGSVWQTDSEWYLSECLFELENYILAEEAYQSIMDQGPGHPFFADAVRRQLELYGITGQGEKFYKVYETFIVSNRVPPTDLVKYTVAKSFYRQGELARAKSLLQDVPEGSMFFGRARYIMGVMLVVDGQLADAILEFEKVSTSSINTAEDREVVDLANLALGRLYYEQGDLSQSSSYYQKIGRTSPYFADALYEISWTFIKDGDYPAALQSVEIFLLGFPDHRYSAELRLLQGHLNMKEAQYDSALQNYESIVDDYTPVEEALAAISRDEYKPTEWFNTLVELDSLDKYYGQEIPEYALEMLAADPEVARAVSLSKELTRQQLEIEESEVLIAELNDAFAKGARSISSYNQGRLELQRLQGEVVMLKASLLEAEEAWLLDNLPDNLAVEVRALRAEREKLAQGEGAANTAKKKAETEATAIETRMAAMEKDMSKISITIDELDTQITTIEARLAESTLPPEDRGEVERELNALNDDLKAGRAELNRLKADYSTLQTKASELWDAAESSGNAAISAGYDSLHRQLVDYRRHVRSADKNAIAGRMDSAWTRLQAIDNNAAQLKSELGGLEAKEFTRLKSTFDAEVGNVAVERNELDDAQDGMTDLASDITREGLERVRAEFAESVLEADKGVVDVYWVKKVDVSDEYRALQKEQEALVRELNGRFRLIRSGLPDPTLNVPTDPSGGN